MRTDRVRFGFALRYVDFDEVVDMDRAPSSERLAELSSSLQLHKELS